MSSSGSVAQHVRSTILRFQNKSLRCLSQSQVAGEHTPRKASRSAFQRSVSCARVRQAQCPLCQGHTQVACDACGGHGRLTKGGYHANNPVAVARIVGSKWTALHRTLGWRHFTATHKMKAGRHTYALLVATCDNTASLWINVRNLKSRERWASGWLQKCEIEAMEDRGLSCAVCAGTGRMTCPRCVHADVHILR